MTLTEEDILKVFEDSDEEEVSCLDENKDLKFKNQICPLDNEGVAPNFLPLPPFASTFNRKAPRNFEGVRNQIELDSYIERQDQKPTKTNPSSAITEPNAENLMKEVDTHFFKTYICLDCEKRKQYLERSSVTDEKKKLSSGIINKPKYCQFCGKKFLQIRKMDFV